MKNTFVALRSEGFIHNECVLKKTKTFWYAKTIRRIQNAFKTLKATYLVHIWVIHDERILAQVGTTQPAKSLKSNTGGGSFCWIGIQYAMPYCQKYTPPHCFFCNFAGWVTGFSSYRTKAKLQSLVIIGWNIILNILDILIKKIVIPYNYC